MKQFCCSLFEGSSKPSITKSLFTLTTEPGRAPTRVRAKSLSASEIEVSWKALPWNASKRRVLGYEVSSDEIPCLCVLPMDALLCVRVCVCMATNAVESCCLPLLMSVSGSCTLGIQDNSLLHA